jgi:hypothetical protein
MSRSVTVNLSRGAGRTQSFDNVTKLPGHLTNIVWKTVKMPGDYEHAIFTCQLLSAIEGTLPERRRRITFKVRAIYSAAKMTSAAFSAII